MKMDKCSFSTGIDDSLTCSKSGFCDLGFPLEDCPEYPCEKHKELKEDLKKFGKENKNVKHKG
jgi:DNA polymerase III sliding clamp (beta) subunit (PCNA family)